MFHILSFSMFKLTIVDVAVVVFETSHNGTVRL